MMRGNLVTLRKQGQSFLTALNALVAGQPLYPASA
jgi:hypothetical protein